MPPAAAPRFLTPLFGEGALGLWPEDLGPLASGIGPDGVHALCETAPWVDYDDSPLAAAFASTESAPTAPLERRYTPHPGKQAAFDAADEYIVFFGGGKGAAKSYALLHKVLKGVHRPACNVFFLRVDLPSLREVLDKALLLYRRLGATWRASERRFVWPWGARIEFGYCETLLDCQRYQGRQPTTIAFDEIGQLANQNVYHTLLAEIRAVDPLVPRQFLGTLNPGGPGEPWIVAEVVKPCGFAGERVVVDPDEPTMTKRFIPATVLDNPSLCNDAKYMATLRRLPKRLREQLLEGKWGVGIGRALDELREGTHIIKPFPIPDRWTQWSSLDWGYGHPFAAGWFACDEDGTVYLVDSVHGHRMLPWDQAQRIASVIPPRALRRCVAGHDVFHKHEARGATGPTLAESFLEYGILCVEAGIDRILGLNNFREYLTTEEVVDVRHTPAMPGQAPAVTITTRSIAPRFYILDTPGNRITFAALEAMVTDPKHQEDALKRDANPDTGDGGDDPYDMARYGLMERMLRGKAPALPHRGTFHPDVMREQSETERRVRSSPPPKGRGARARKVPIDPAYGGM